MRQGHGWMSLSAAATAALRLYLSCASLIAIRSEPAKLSRRKIVERAMTASLFLSARLRRNCKFPPFPSDLSEAVNLPNRIAVPERRELKPRLSRSAPVTADLGEQVDDLGILRNGGDQQGAVAVRRLPLITEKRCRLRIDAVEEDGGGGLRLR